MDFDWIPAVRHFFSALHCVLAFSLAGTAISAAQPTTLVDGADGAALQRALDQQAKAGGIVRIQEPRELTCLAQESEIEGEVSRHALLIPEGVTLDLNGSTLRLDLRSNCYGVRLSSRSAVRNGTIRVVHSENKGSQAIWHAGISIGAAYDDGGTPARPSRFAKVAHWTIENITIDQPFQAAAIQLMSESCHGVIRQVRILDSPQALLGIGMDWGTVGNMTTVDAELPRMRQRWEAGQFYSTHPHDILVEDIEIGHLTRNVDANDAGVRCSACYNITIRNVRIASAAAAVAIFGGDCGFEFAPAEVRSQAHRGYRIEDVAIEKAYRCGIVLNGLADNSWRARQSHNYEPLIDPARPGLRNVVISRSSLQGAGMSPSQGMFITAVSDVRVEDVAIQDFTIGLRIKDWIDGLQFEHTRIARAEQPRSFSSSSATPEGVTFDGKPVTIDENMPE